MAEERVGLEVRLDEPPGRGDPPLVLAPLLPQHIDLEHVYPLLRQLHNRLAPHLHRCRL